MNGYVNGEKTAHRFSLRPAVQEEKELFFSMEKEKALELGVVGHVRIDFGRHGDEFWPTWWTRGKKEWKHSYVTL